jgi:hypothetical protein
MSAEIKMSTTQLTTFAEDLCCSICLDDIDVSMNVIKTECKHCFHSKCFLQNAAHNGFNCPLCRNELAEVPRDEDDEDDEYDDEEDEEDFSLRASRWLFMRAEGEPIDEDDTDDETLSDDSNNDTEYVRYVSEEIPVISIAQVTDKIRQRGVTYEQLVALLILPDSRSAADMIMYDNDFMRDLDQMFCEIVNGNNNNS